MNPAYRPMLATLVDAPFDDKTWVFETKWDGFRLITENRGHAIKLWSRNGIDVTTRYAMLLPALQKIDGSCVLDGELCALEAHGRSRFQLLQNVPEIFPTAEKASLDRAHKFQYVLPVRYTKEGGRQPATTSTRPQVKRSE